MIDSHTRLPRRRKAKKWRKFVRTDPGEHPAEEAVEPPRERLLGSHRAEHVFRAVTAALQSCAKRSIIKFSFSVFVPSLSRQMILSHHPLF
jgi:hypothetical protein